MDFITNFFIAFGLSFIGSLPFGMINMTVAHTAIRKGFSHGLSTAVGAALVELVQVLIALKFTWLFNENPNVERIFLTIATVVFFAGGIYFLFFAKSKPAIKEGEEAVKYKKRGDFMRGVGISSLNLMVIPYWIFYATLLTTNGILVKDNQHVLVFSVGVMFGTFTLLVCYALLGAKILSKSEQITRWVNKIIGLILLGFGIYQLLKLTGIV